MLSVTNIWFCFNQSMGRVEWLCMYIDRKERDAQVIRIINLILRKTSFEDKKRLFKATNFSMKIANKLYDYD